MRTYIMVKNVPNTYTQEKFVEEFKDTHDGTYDNIQVICDKKQGKCKGFGFINFLHPLYLVDFYATYNGSTWKQDQTKKRIIELRYATKEVWNKNFTWSYSQKLLNLEKTSG